MLKLRYIDDLYDFLGYVILSAPDNFPVEDFLAADDQMNLNKAFKQLRDGVEIAYPETFFPEKKPALYALLDRSLAAYRAGDDVASAHLLQDFEASIFKD